MDNEITPKVSVFLRLLQRLQTLMSEELYAFASSACLPVILMPDLLVKALFSSQPTSR